MKKRFIYGIILVLFLGVLSGCTSKSAQEFKEAYEAINGKENASGKIHRTITIDSNNPFKKVSAEEIVEKIENKETFYVYFGDELCPWCRSVIEKFIEVAHKHDIKTVYYVKIWDSEGNEVVRDKLSVNDNNELEQVVKGSDAYYKLLGYFDNVLSDYDLGDDVETNEKRIYAPNYIYVENGVAVKMTEGISSLQEDAREELTSEMLAEEESLFEEFFTK